jgi:hypothetical protein
MTITFMMNVASLVYTIILMLLRTQRLVCMPCNTVGKKPPGWYHMTVINSIHTGHWVM